MIYTILESIRYTLTLLFGIFVSVLFLDIRINKRMSFVFFYSFILIQYYKVFSILLKIYRLLFLYILLLPIYHFQYFCFNFQKRLFPSLIAITSAYLCCQISNWTTIFVSSFIKNIDNITYSLTLIISFVFIIKFVYLPISQLLKNNHMNLFLLVSFQCSIIYLIIFLPFIQSFFILEIKQLQNLHHFFYVSVILYSVPFILNNMKKSKNRNDQ